MDITKGLVITIKNYSHRKKIFIKQQKIIENFDKYNFILVVYKVYIIAFLFKGESEFTI
jgi:hypothetical protein